MGWTVICSYVFSLHWRIFDCSVTSSFLVADRQSDTLYQSNIVIQTGISNPLIAMGSIITSKVRIGPVFWANKETINRKARVSIFRSAFTYPLILLVFSGFFAEGLARPMQTS